MAKVDWTFKDEVKPSDMNQIGQEINELKENTEGSAEWQKHKLTQDDGINKLLEVNYDLNKLFEAGVYSVPAPLNGPTVADWYYVEVFVHSVVFVMQRATLLSTSNTERDSEVYVRTTSNGLESWRPWKRMTDFDVPDASLTVKGKVQLSNKVDDTTQSIAATSKAVNDARIAAQDNAKSYVDAKDWQKFPLTQSSGLVKSLAAYYDVNNLLTPGQYDCQGPTNGPWAGDTASWFYIEVIVHSFGDSYVMQRATALNQVGGSAVFVRIRADKVWSTWEKLALQSSNNLWGAI